MHSMSTQTVERPFRLMWSLSSSGLWALGTKPRRAAGALATPFGTGVLACLAERHRTSPPPLAPALKTQNQPPLLTRPTRPATPPRLEWFDSSSSSHLLGVWPIMNGWSLQWSLEDWWDLEIGSFGSRKAKSLVN